MSNVIKVFVNIKPLSINKAFQGRRFKTKEYKEYEKEFLVLLPERKKMEGKVGINLTFFLHHPQQSDVDNFLKLILDILQKKEYIKNDNNVYYLQAQKLKIERHEIEAVKILIFEFVEIKNE